MPNLLLVSHTPSSNARALNEAVIKGAGHEDINKVELKVIEPLKAVAEDVLWANGIILGTTENFGYMSGALKDFFDRIYYPCLDATQALPYTLYIKAGMDGQGALLSIERIVTGLRWKRVQEPLICVGQPDSDNLQQAEELGMAMAAGLEAGIF